MELDEELWAMSGGAGPQWKAVLDMRARQALGGLQAVSARLRRGLPAALEPFKLPSSVSFFLSSPAPERDRMALFPAFDYWLSACGLEGEWERHLPSFQSFAAALAVSTKASRRFPARLTEQGRFHATGTREYFEFPASCAGSPVIVEAAQGRLTVTTPDGRRGRRRLLPQAAPGVWVESRDPLVLGPVYVNPPAPPDARAEAAFARVLSRALVSIRRFDGPAHEEMCDFLRVLVPLANPRNKGSVSSSYQNLRGALGLSHSEDGLLQEETLIHEFCHQKLNLLAEVDLLIEPGQSGQIFYSPLRPDARRLRGLLLGAHAFLNVNRYLLRVLGRKGRLKSVGRDCVIRNVSRRTLHVEDMLRSVSGYATLTPFGARFILRLWRELMLHRHAALSFPREVQEEVREQYRAHRSRHALGDTGYYQQPPAGQTEQHSM